MIERRVLKEKEKRRVKKGGGAEQRGVEQEDQIQLSLKKKKVTFFKVKSLFSLKWWGERFL